jgi:hypothetical protein
MLSYPKWECSLFVERETKLAYKYFIQSRETNSITWEDLKHNRSLSLMMKLSFFFVVVVVENFNVASFDQFNPRFLICAYSPQNSDHGGCVHFGARWHFR